MVRNFHETLKANAADAHSTLPNCGGRCRAECGQIDLGASVAAPQQNLPTTSVKRHHTWPKCSKKRAHDPEVYFELRREDWVLYPDGKAPQIDHFLFTFVQDHRRSSLSAEGGA